MTTNWTTENVFKNTKATHLPDPRSAISPLKRYKFFSLGSPCDTNIQSASLSCPCLVNQFKLRLLHLRNPPARNDDLLTILSYVFWTNSLLSPPRLRPERLVNTIWQESPWGTSRFVIAGPNGENNLKELANACVVLVLDWQLQKKIADVSPTTTTFPSLGTSIRPTAFGRTLAYSWLFNSQWQHTPQLMNRTTLQLWHYLHSRLRNLGFRACTIQRQSRLSLYDIIRFISYQM